jgi:hypothetical protein
MAQACSMLIMAYHGVGVSCISGCRLQLNDHTIESTSQYCLQYALLHVQHFTLNAQTKTCHCTAWYCTHYAGCCNSVHVHCRSYSCAAHSMVQPQHMLHCTAAIPPTQLVLHDCTRCTVWCSTCCTGQPLHPPDSCCCSCVPVYKTACYSIIYSTAQLPSLRPAPCCCCMPVHIVRCWWSPQQCPAAATHHQMGPYKGLTG